MTTSQSSSAKPSGFATLRTIDTPWTPYAIAFSPDGQFLAIGGGSSRSGGGILLVDCTAERSRLFDSDELPQLSEGAVSGMCYAADARHLVISAWESAQGGGRVAVFESEGLELRNGAVSVIEYASRSVWASGITLHDGIALVRNHHSILAEQFTAVPLPVDVHRGSVKQFGNQRLVVAGDFVITGNHGEPNASGSFSRGRLIVAPLDNLTSPTIVEVESSDRITAIAHADGYLVTGGSRGELDVWWFHGHWQRRRIRHVEALQSASGVVDICAIPHGRVACVTPNGGLWLFDVTATRVSRVMTLPIAPCSLAAHPDGHTLAVGIMRRGGPHDSHVVLLDLRTPIDPAWCTAAVRSLTHESAAQPTPETFAVLADALEQAGAGPELFHHLRGHDHALSSCWIIDALVAAVSNDSDESSPYP